MNKNKRGMKHKCMNCATLFYDLGRCPIACPKCNTRLDVTTQVKGRKGRGLVEDKELLALANPLDEVILDEDLTSEGLNEDDLLEDASELGDEKDEVNEVIEDAEPEETEDE